MLFSIYENGHSSVETFGVSTSTGKRSKDIVAIFSICTTKY